MQMSPKCICPHNIIVIPTKMSPKLKYHKKASVIKTEMSPKCRFHQTANTKVTKTQMSLKCKCHQKANIWKRNFHQTSNINWNLPNVSDTTRSPGQVHIIPNGLPGHGLSDSRLVNNLTVDFERLVSLQKCVTCHMSHITCHMSHVMCQVPPDTFFFFFYIWQRGQATWWRVCYQQGWPCLVLSLIH